MFRTLHIHPIDQFTPEVGALATTDMTTSSAQRTVSGLSEQHQCNCLAARQDMQMLQRKWTS